MTGQSQARTDTRDGKNTVPGGSPVTPQDVPATTCRHLGVDPGRPFTDTVGKPVPIRSRGEPIREQA